MTRCRYTEDRATGLWRCVREVHDQPRPYAPNRPNEHWMVNTRMTTT